MNSQTIFNNLRWSWIPVFIYIFVFTPSRISFGQSKTEPLFTGRDMIEETGVVDKVASADTFYLKTGVKVQMIGLKSIPMPPPEKREYDQYGFVVRKDPQPPLPGEQALDFVRSLIEGKEVRLEFDFQKQGDSQIVLAYVYLKDSGLFINEEILKHGYASLSLTPPNMKYSGVLRAAYQEAYIEKRGLHSQ